MQKTEGKTMLTYGYDNVVIPMEVLQDPIVESIVLGCLDGKQEFRRTDFGSRLLAADGEGGGGSKGEGKEERCG